MQKIIALLVANFITLLCGAQLQVSSDHHHFTKNGKPFLWLGDTAWELFQRLNREEAVQYLDNRAAKGFNVIQAVALAELDGLGDPNAYGDLPLINNDPTKPNEAYFKHVDFIVNEANKRGLIIAMLPSWGDKWNKGWGVGPEIFNPENAKAFGKWIGKRYKDKSIVWVMGGDRAVENAEDSAIIRAMVAGIKSEDHSHLFTFHPTGGQTSSQYFGNDQWIDFHMSQTGHWAGSPDYKRNIEAYEAAIAKPHVNGEPNYEDHPNDFKPVQKGWMDEVDTREAAYWNMLSGGAGHTYGNHNIWQMYDEKRAPVNNARITWQVAMDQPGAFEVGYMKKMLEKRNWQRLRYDPGVIEGNNPEGVQFKLAALSLDHDFMMVYIPYGDSTTVNTSKVNARQLKGWWFNPRDGRSISLGTFENKGSETFRPTSVGRGSDWVLILDDAEKNYPDPDIRK